MECRNREKRKREFHEGLFAALRARPICQAKYAMIIDEPSLRAQLLCKKFRFFLSFLFSLLPLFVHRDPFQSQRRKKKDPMAQRRSLRTYAPRTSLVFVCASLSRENSLCTYPGQGHVRQVTSVCRPKLGSLRCGATVMKASATVPAAKRIGHRTGLGDVLGNYRVFVNV